MWAISNGTELDAYEDLLAPDALSRIQITVDGPQAEHDRRRVYADGSGSWQAIARNVTLALERGVFIAIRTNVDRNNLQHLEALADEFIGRGWDRYPNFTSQIAPIRAANGKTDSKSTLNTWQIHKHMATLRNQCPNLEVLGTVDDSLKNQAHRIFTQQGPPAFKPAFCAAHTGMYIFDAFGDIYSCWDRTGDRRMRIGFVTEEGELRLIGDQIIRWHSRNVASNPVCLRCRYNLYCGGGCAVLAEDHNGNFQRNYCDGFAHRFRESVAEAFLEFVQGGRIMTKPAGFCDL